MNDTGTTLPQQTTRNPAQATCLAPKKVFMPRADVYESREAIVVLADMPGVDQAGVDITLEKNVLTLRGSVAAPEFLERRLAWEEYAIGDYERTFTIGTDIDSDGITATVKNGVLKVSLPKVQTPKARKISVKAE